MNINKDLNLVEILKDCPKGTKLYSTVHGEEEFKGIVSHSTYPIRTKKHSYTSDGKLYDNDGECVLFPSKDQRDWENFVPPIKKWNPTELQSFDKILVRDYDYVEGFWNIDLFGFIDKGTIIGSSGTRWDTAIPYNEDTKHLLGTKNNAPEKYKWWEE